MFILIALAFLALWFAVYLAVVRPALRSYRDTAGIYARLDAFEAGLWARVVLLLKGLKVALVALVTSAAPVAAVFYEKVSGIDWTKYLPGEKAQVVALGLLALGVLGPVLMAVLHMGALAEASAADPHKPAAAGSDPEG